MKTNNTTCHPENIFCQAMTISAKEDIILDEYTIYVLEIFTNCVMINIIGVFGIIGNSLNIAVLWKHGFRETTNIILVSLAVSDLVFSAMLPASRLHCITSQFDIAFTITLNTFITVYLFMPKYVCLGTSLSYVTIIAIERFVAVFFPFKVAKIFKKTTVTKIVIIFPIVSLVVMIPTFLTVTFKWTYNPILNRTVAVTEYTSFYTQYKDIIDIYAWIGLNNFFCVLSVSITSLCCIAIGWKLYQAAIKRESMTSKSTGYDVRVVRMLVTICIVFLVVMIPNIALYTYYVPGFVLTSRLHEIVDNFIAILYAVNSSANFLVYVTMSKKFAKTYKSLLVCEKTR